MFLQNNTDDFAAELPVAGIKIGLEDTVAVFFLLLDFNDLRDSVQNPDHFRVEPVNQFEHGGGISAAPGVAIMSLQQMQHFIQRPRR